MLAPKPGQNLTYPKPTRIISKAELAREWKASRDATGKPGSKGVDNVTAAQFAARLDANLIQLARDLKEGKFGFSKLRAVFIPKPNSEKERIICIPTVRDRLIQRVIVSYLVRRKALPIYNSSSFGFIKGIGTEEAIKRVVELRGKYDWCLKTDIEAFFDRIPRNYLKACVKKSLGGHSLTPLICKAINCEAKVTRFNKLDFDKQGVKPGTGVRQGMPLSPLLANLVLSEFDRSIEKSNIEMVRYADDLILFFNSKSDAYAGKQTVIKLLQELELNIPKIAADSKTSIVSPGDPVTFLGREIVFLESANAYVARISIKQIKKIKARLTKEYSFSHRHQKGKTFQDTIVDISRSIAAYLGIYRNAYNFSDFESDLRGHSRILVTQLFRELFGETALGSLSLDGRKFLGIEVFDTIEPNPELEL